MERPEVFAGALRDPNESGALSVTLSVWSDQIVMHNDDVELGEWPRDIVRIIPLDSSSYEFVAEGDRLVFIPDDRVAFASVATPSASTTTKQAPEKRKKSKTTSRNHKPAATQPPKATKRVKLRKPKRAKAASTPVKSETPKRAKRVRTKAANRSVASAAGTNKPTRSRLRMWSRSAEKPAADTSTSQPRVASVKPPGPAVATATRTTVEVDAPKKQRRSLRVRPLKVASLKPGRREAADSGKAGVRSRTRPKRWIRLIDTVRVYSAFGLDRVPVDTSLRGSEHQHTWDHRAAASSGPSKHICTICGKLTF